MTYGLPLPRWGTDTPGTPLPLHPDLTGQPDEIVDAIFDRILRDEGKWQIVDAAKANHEKHMANLKPTFNVQAYAEAMGLTIVRRLA